MPKVISVASTYATDIILDDKKKVISTQSGGPLFFIKRVFEEQKVNSELYHGDNAQVEIMLGKGEEFGRVTHNAPKIYLSELGNVDWLMISTVLDEWIIDSTSANKIFIDIQGFVRVGRTFKKKHNWHLEDDFADSVYCIKGTQEEIKYLDPAFIDQQKNKLLIVTKGSNGADLYYKGKSYTFKPKKILKLNNSIGAGDTLFAYFVAYIAKHHDPLLAMSFATDSTGKYLESRN